MKKIGLLIIATNKYIGFLNQLIEGADNFFLKDCDVTYYIFTNKNISINTKRNYQVIDVEHKPWPWMTLGRYEIFLSNSSIIKSMDYLFYCDVDIKIVNEVGNEILSDLVVTQHPLYAGTRGTPEKNPISTACVFPNENMQYFAGGFNGGKTENYLKMCEIISNNIKQDLEKNYIAIWHDESHLNRYMIDNPPTKILSKHYCYPELNYIPKEVKIVALNKNHKEMRSEIN
jgi:histo-blood group ABO system transferase